MTRMKVLVTGANGFIGKNLCLHLHEQDLEVVKFIHEMPVSDLINKLELLSMESRHKDYYTNMYKVVKELDGLTKLHLKTIDKISQSSSDKNIKEIKKLIPEQLLKSLLRAYTEVELKKDALIITEQIND